MLQKCNGKECLSKCFKLERVLFSTIDTSNYYHLVPIHGDKCTCSNSAERPKRTFSDIGGSYVCLPVHPRPHAMFVFAMTEIHVPDQLSSLLEWWLIEAVELDTVRHALWMSKLTVLSHVLDKLCL